MLTMRTFNLVSLALKTL